MQCLQCRLISKSMLYSLWYTYIYLSSIPYSGEIIKLCKIETKTHRQKKNSKNTKQTKEDRTKNNEEEGKKQSKGSALIMDDKLHYGCM